MLNSNVKGKVLFTTNNSNTPFLIRTPREGKEDIFIAVKKDSTLTGDGFYKSELTKYYPNIDMSQFQDINSRVSA